jgi:hypothetical protein
MAGPQTNRTAVTHPQVGEYLRQLDAALRLVPAARATELREQITTHLDDALPPGASDQEVAEVLKGLGRPSDLAAEAMVTAGKRPWPARLSWRAWALVTAVVLAVAAVAGYLAVMLSAAPIVPDGGYSWWYTQDGQHQVRSSADGRDESTVPIRPGQQQGFAVQLYNPSDQTQTVLGTSFDTGPGCVPVQVSVSAKDPDLNGQDITSTALDFTRPGSIPPHGSRVLRVMWRSANCLEKNSYLGIDSLPLQVRVGLLTRTEVVSLQQAWTLTGK